MRTLITNGTIVTAEGSTAADVLIDGETIAAIGTGLAAGRRDRRRDDRRDGPLRDPRRDRRPHPHGAAVRRHVRQGHVRDGHAGRGVRRDDDDRRLRGPVARQVAPRGPRRLARQGGGQRRRRLRLPHDHERRQRRHASPRWTTLVAEGVPDFKLFTAYPGVFYSDDGAIFRAMQRTAKNGGLIMMHAENGMAIDVVAADEVAAGARPIPYYHGVARYPIFEGEATNRVIRLAEAAGVPVYIVHLSARDALDAVREARGSRRQGLRRDVPAVPVPLARRPGQRVRGREVRLLAAAPPEGPPGRALDGPPQGRPPGRLDRPLPVRLPRPEGARPGRLPEDPERPAGRRGPGRPPA